MTKTRLYLFMFGIISVFLLSSFGVWRIMLDSSAVRSRQAEIDLLCLAQESATEMIVMIQEIRALSGSWILLPENSENKARLKELVSNRIFITEFKWDDKYQPRIRDVVTRIDSMIRIQEEDIVANLITLDDYEVPTKRLLAEDGYDEIDSQATTTLEMLYELYDEVHKELVTSKERVSVRAKTGTIILVILEILMFLAGLTGLIILVTSPAWKALRELA